jgi:hypothetical protein
VRAILVAILLWFVVDSGAPAYHGAWFNIVRIDLVALTATGLGLAGNWPLVAAR